MKVKALDENLYLKERKIQVKDLASKKDVDNLKYKLEMGKPVKTGKKRGELEEYEVMSEFTFGSSTGTWYEILKISENAILKGFQAHFEVESQYYYFPFSYNNQEITTYYDSSTGSLSAQFNYAWAAERNGVVYATYYA